MMGLFLSNETCWAWEAPSWELSFSDLPLSLLLQAGTEDQGQRWSEEGSCTKRLARLREGLVLMLQSCCVCPGLPSPAFSVESAPFYLTRA